MRNLLKTFGSVAVAAASIYGLVWIVAGFWGPPGAPTRIDSQRGESDYYRTPIREFVYQLPAFCADAVTTRKNLFIIGGSTAKAYRPNVMEPELPGWTVSNISLDFANITQIRQAFELMRSCLDPAVLRNSRFVLGFTYILLAPNHLRWPTPYTMLELDMLRHGLFAGSPGSVNRVYSWPRTRIAITAMRPIFLAYALSLEAWKSVTGVADRLGGRLLDQNPEVQRQREYQSLSTILGPFEPGAMDEQIHELETLETEIRAAGSDIILLDIPVAPWLDNRSPHLAWYRSWILAHTRDKGIAYLAPPPATNPNEFAGLVHATPAGAARWSKEAAARLSVTLSLERRPATPSAKTP